VDILTANSLAPTTDEQLSLQGSEQPSNLWNWKWWNVANFAITTAAKVTNVWIWSCD